MSSLASPSASSSWALDHFVFDPATTFLGSFHACCFGILGYLGLLWLLKRYVKTDWGARLQPFLVYHNASLCIGSAILLFFTVQELVHLTKKSSLWEVYCDEEARFTGGRIYFFYYINYLFKWWELLDTVLLVLRKKPTPFLHVYHHSATLFLCWTQMYYESCMQWVLIVINLLIHVFMYYYYAATAHGIKVWWKEYLTGGQITQFIIGLTNCIGVFTMRLLRDMLNLNWSYCHGSYKGGLIGIFFIFTYLLLFVKLYKDKYKKTD